ncbi:MAG TPA: M28 family peptidase [Chitinophagales bacterium]|nr:M28 family peptidase [Chitinophagales bacterium]
MLSRYRKIFTFIITLFLSFLLKPSYSQTNILSTNPVAEQVMTGNYDPTTFLPPVILNHPDTIITGILTRINSDTLLSDLIRLASFQNRNTGSDTISSVKGIGAARRWVYQKFQQISNANDNRLIPSYLQFDSTICTIKQHRCPFAVLPGLDTTDPSIIIIESHLDSRCEVLCDTACVAQGVDDNGSGTALVIELARVLSKYAFKHTIVFLTNIGEEQGLDGAIAFAVYAQQKNISIKAVENNDIVGGILCGHTSSPPSCSPFGDIDSTQLRLFSFGGFNSAHKGFVRFIKLEYKENLLPFAIVPMTISVMTAEDRTGRGGDHIPFRERGFTAMRFTSANENGNANVADTTYQDNQHTTRDVLGYDTNGDLIIDSFLVDVHYLTRNAQINANAAAMAAIGVFTPDFSFATSGNDLQITIDSQTQYSKYRVGVRSNSFDFDSVYTINGTSGSIHFDSSGIFVVSVASVDSNGIESFFNGEKFVTITGIQNISQQTGIHLMPMKPNPADEATMISVFADNEIANAQVKVRITDTNGILVKELPLTINKGLNEVLYKHGPQPRGTYIVQLVVDGKTVATSSVIFSR